MSNAGMSHAGMSHAGMQLVARQCGKQLNLRSHCVPATRMAFACLTAGKRERCCLLRDPRSVVIHAVAHSPPCPCPVWLPGLPDTMHSLAYSSPLPLVLTTPLSFPSLSPSPTQAPALPCPLPPCLASPLCSSSSPASSTCCQSNTSGECSSHPPSCWWTRCPLRVLVMLKWVPWKLNSTHHTFHPTLPPHSHGGAPPLCSSALLSFLPDILRRARCPAHPCLRPNTAVRLLGVWQLRGQPQRYRPAIHRASACSPVALPDALGSHVARDEA